MKSLYLIIFAVLALVLTPVLAYGGQTYQTSGASATGPPLSQPLVREGTVAVTLVGTLHLGNTTNESEAESLLSAAGVAPHNGWIADYPITPDIVAELRDAVANAAAAGTVTLSKDEAVVAFDNVMSQYNLTVTADTSGKTTTEQSAATYPDSAAAGNYYSDEGPPVVTYYAPPVDYASLYTWVPYPFWWASFWFPGFFVLADFDVPFFVGGHVFFCSNHFFDRDDHAFVRVNAFDRFERFHNVAFSRVAAADRTRVVGPSTVRTGAESVFRHDRGVAVDRGRGSIDRGSSFRNNRAISPRGNERMTSPSRERGFAPSDSSRSDRVVSNGNFNRGMNFSRPAMNRTVPERNSMINRPVDRSPRTFAPPSRSFSAPSGGGRTFSAPSFRQSAPSFGGGRSFGGFGGGFGGGMRR